MWDAELLGVSPGSKQCTTFLNLPKYDEIMSKNQFTGTATQPQCNRKFCQFNKDQYCIPVCAIKRGQSYHWMYNLRNKDIPVYVWKIHDIGLKYCLFYVWLVFYGYNVLSIFPCLSAVLSGWVSIVYIVFPAKFFPLTHVCHHLHIGSPIYSY